MDIDCSDYLKSLLTASAASVKPLVQEIISDYEKKLWHQLTVKLEKLVTLPEAKGHLLPLYEKFISTFEKKINQLTLARIAIVISHSLNDNAKSIAFLTSIAGKVLDQKRVDANVLCIMEAAHFKLLSGDAPGTLAATESCQLLLDGLHDVDPLIHASFYRVAADYDKVKANYSRYYKNALLYLACIPDVQKDLSKAERTARAHDLGLSALLGDTIYNFGELLLHPILDSLNDSPHAWLKKALFAFNSGDWTQFEALSSTFASNQLLVANAPFLRQKMCLMALIETVFRHGSLLTNITFAEIAAGTRLPLVEVEHLIMKALSLKLIRGTLDEVDQVLHVTWVQPRVLDKGQIKKVKDAIGAWREKVKITSQLVERETTDLIVQ